jgi:uncharacterized protein YndB with AHSA1/START domain
MERMDRSETSVAMVGTERFYHHTQHFDMRVGGQWRFVMHGPDGRDYENIMTYDEIVKPERLAYSHGGAGDTAAIQFKVVVTFEDMGEQTRLTMQAIFPTAAERDYVAREHGAVEGGQQTLARLAEFLSQH